jgi:hypothetical protein
VPRGGVKVSYAAASDRPGKGRRAIEGYPWACKRRITLVGLDEGRRFGAPLDCLWLFAYSNVQVGVLVWPFVLGDGVKLPSQVTTS